MSMKMSKISSILLCSVALVLAFYNDTAQAQDLDVLPFSLDGSSNECYVQCPTECPQLNLDMVDCVVYCKMKCACPADDTDCVTQAMDKMQKAADERESVIGPDDEELEEAAETSESEGVDISEAGASDSDAAFAPEAFAPESEERADGDLAFAAEDGGDIALSPADALAPETDTTSFVIEMDVTPSPASDGAAPTPSEEAPAGSEAATPQSTAAHTPTGSIAPTTQGARAPGAQNAAASPAPQIVAPGPNAASPA